MLHDYLESGLLPLNSAKLIFNPSTGSDGYIRLATLEQDTTYTVSPITRPTSLGTNRTVAYRFSCKLVIPSSPYFLQANVAPFPLELQGAILPTVELYFGSHVPESADQNYVNTLTSGSINPCKVIFSNCLEAVVAQENAELRTKASIELTGIISSSNIAITDI